MRSRLRDFPAKVLLCSHKPHLDITTTPARLRKTIHHRGVSFEILSPYSHQNSRSCRSLLLKPHSSSFESNQMETPREAPRRRMAQSRVRSLSEGHGRLRTPSRTLFDDLETAHSSITSRFAAGNDPLVTCPDQRTASIHDRNLAETVDNASMLSMQSSTTALLPHPFDADYEDNVGLESPFRSRLSLRIREWSQTTALQAFSNFEKRKYALAKRVSSNWPFKAVKNRNRRRKPNKLVKRPKPSPCGGRAPELHFHESSARNSQISTLGGLLGAQGRPYVVNNNSNNPTNDGLTMFEVRRRNALGVNPTTESGDSKEESPAANEQLQTDNVGESEVTNGQAHKLAFDHQETLTESANLAVPHGQTQVDIGVGLRDATRQGTGASSPSFSRPFAPAKWFASRRRSPFKPISHSKRLSRAATVVEGAAGATHPNRGAQRDNERSILKLLSPQSALINREIERGLFHDQPFGSSNTHLTDEVPVDFGPGSSQSSSTQHFSQYIGSSSGLLSAPGRLALSSSAQFSEPEAAGSSLRSEVEGRSSTGRVGSIKSRKNTCAALNKHAEQLESKAIPEEDDAEHDWETVAGSQQFTSGMNSFRHHHLGHGVTHGSLADFSSYGSLANSRSNRKQMLRSSNAIRPSTAGESSNTVRVPAYADPNRHSHYFHQDPTTGQYVLLANANYRHSGGARLNAFSRPVPALIASTSRCPTPLPNRYRHPSPLGDHHANPFCSTPPSLSGQLARGKEPTTGGNGHLTVGDSKSISSENNESKIKSHRDYGKLRREISNSARTSFQHWLSEVVAKEPSERSSQGSYLRHHLNKNFQSAGIPNSQNNSSINAERSVSNADNNTSSGPVPVDRELHPSLRGYPPVTRLATHSELRRVDSNTPSRSLSTDHLLPAPPGINKNLPGSLYLSIRSARDRVLKNAQKGKAGGNPVLETTQADSQHESSVHGPNSTELTDNQISRQETLPSSIFHTARSTLLRTPTVTRRSSTRQSSKTPKPDDLLRERLEQLDPALLAQFCLPSSNSRLSRATWEPRLIPADNNTWTSVHAQAAIPGPSASNRTDANIISVIDEEAALSSPRQFEQDSNAFPDPPQLVPVRRRSARVNLTQQRRLGRQFILWCSLFVPLGWFVVALIGFGATHVSESIMKWRSGGAVDMFHDKEELLARRLSIAYAVSLFVVAMVIVAVFISV